MSENDDPKRNPHKRQMVDESMVRGLAAQAAAIWPQESQIIAGYVLPDSIDVLDVGCGTGEFTSRMADLFPQATLTGVDVLESPLELALRRDAALAPRVRYERADAFELPFAAESFDFLACRHMLQSVPQPERVLAEMLRVARPGARLHVLSEDYAMIHFHPVPRDTDVFWRDGPVAFGEATGTDLRYGRKTWQAMHALGLEWLAVHYVVVDTLRVPRETVRDIWLAWRDGYSDVIAANTRLARDEVAAYWQAMIDCLERPDGYAVWQVPIVTGVKPTRGERSA